MSSPYKTFSIKSFGCKVNLADASMISKKLIQNGFSFVDFNDIADLYVINTCSVTNNADLKAEKFIKEVNLRAPQSKIIITGCYAQLNPDRLLKNKGVDIVIGTEDKFKIEKYLYDLDESKKFISNINNVNDFQITHTTSERTRSFIKIQDGCSYNCTYCTIPNARGKSRSASIRQTIDKINSIIELGMKEIVLSGINVGDFGDKKENFYMLLKEIEKIDSLKRYRISSIEPNLLNNKILKLLSQSSKALPHFHIPLQSGSNKVLKDMKRRYKIQNYEKLINNIVRLIPNVCIGVDVIVGFPTETSEDFISTYEFLDKLPISYLHVFSYSKRKNTEAEKFNNIVTNEDILYRRRVLQKLSQKKFNIHIEKNIGSVHEVLFENEKNEMMQGLSGNYIRVNVKTKKNLNNLIKKVKIIKNENELIVGEIIG